MTRSGRSLWRVLAFCAPGAVLATVFVGLARWSWRKWPDMLVDFGHELYVPWRMTEGDVLYRDIAWTMGPLSQYFNAALFGTFGVSFTTLIFANLTLLALAVLVVYRIFKIVAPAWVATALGVVMLGVFGFSQYVGVAAFNFIAPYRHELTHGFVLSVAMILFVVRYFETRRRAWIAGIGLCLGAVVLTKSEIAVAATGAAVVGLVLTLRVSRPAFREIWVAAGLATVCAAAPTLLFAGLLARTMPWSDSVRSVFSNWRYSMDAELTRAYPMYVGTLGIDDVSGNLARMFGWFAAFLGVAAALIAGDALVRRLAAPAGRWVSAFAGIAVFAAATTFVPYTTWIEPARALPPIAAGIALAAGWRTWHGEGDRLRSFTLTVWSVFATLALLKLLLHATVLHYGFVLALPVTLLLTLALIWGVPELIRRSDIGTGYVATGVAVALVAAFVFVSWQRSNAYYSGKVTTLGSGGDRFYYNPSASPRRFLLPKVVDYLRDRTPAESTLAVLPEGVTINYLLRRRNPTPFHLVLPWEIRAFGGEATFVEAFANAPPDDVVILSIDTSEHGYPYFGAPGYGTTLTAWIAEQYRNTESLNATDAAGRPIFQASIYRHAPAR